MWSPERVHTKNTILDFRFSGQGKKETTELYLDDFRLSNAVDLVDYNSDSTQFIICSECGMTDCASGDYLTLRRIDNSVVFIPAFEEMRDDSDFQYTPHYEIAKTGGILLDKTRYLEVKSIIKELPDFEDLSALKNSEIPILLQWESTVNALDKFSFPIKFRTDLFLATSSELNESIITKLEELINLFDKSDKDAHFAEIENSDISIFLDIEGYYEWNPIWESNGVWGLKLKPNLYFKLPK